MKLKFIDKMLILNTILLLTIILYYMMIIKKTVKKKSNIKQSKNSYKRYKENLMPPIETSCLEHYSDLSKPNKNTICVISYDNRKVLPENLDKLIKLNRKYCKKYNIKYFFYSKKTIYPPYWTKVLLVLEELKRNRYKYVLWLDTDALIQLNQHLSIFINSHMKNRDMLISSDPPIWRSPFNAGVWCVKNNNKTKQLLEQWLSYYNKDLWNEVDGKWTCRKCQWSGSEYEQGAFVKYILPKYKNNIQSINYKLINNNKYDKNNECIFHFAGQFKSLINKIK